eukprot:scaffold21094_cov110-Isochrysis_galbana.AAC.3
MAYVYALPQAATLRARRDVVARLDIWTRCASSCRGSQSQSTSAGRGIPPGIPPACAPAPADWSAASAGLHASSTPLRLSSNSSRSASWFRSSQPSASSIAPRRVRQGVLHRVAVVLERVFGLNVGAEGLVFLGILVGVGRHLLHLLLGQPGRVVGDGDLLGLAGALLHGGDVEHAVGVNVEGDLDLWDAARHRRDARQRELAQLVVILGARALALEDLDGDGRLIIRVGREDLLLRRWDGRPLGHQRGHHLAARLQPERERGAVEQNHAGRLLRDVVGQDGGLHGGAVRDRLVRVDGARRLLAVEEVSEQGLDLGDAGGATDEHDVVDLGLAHLCVLHHLLDRRHRAAEEVHAQLLEPCTCDGREEVDALEERVDLDGRLGRGGERALGPLARRAQPAQRPRVARDVLLVLALELLHKVVDHAVVEVLAAEVSVACRRLDLEDALVDAE